MPVVFAWAKKPPLCKGGTAWQGHAGGIVKLDKPTQLGSIIQRGSAIWPSGPPDRRSPTAPFTQGRPLCLSSTNLPSAAAQYDRPGTGPLLRFNCNPSSFPCQRGLSSMGMHPLFGLLRALCSFLAPLPCFWAMMRKILPICYLFDSPRPGFALHRPLFALHPNIFPLHRRNFVQSALAPEGKI